VSEVSCHFCARKFIKPRRMLWFMYNKKIPFLKEFVPFVLMLILTFIFNTEFGIFFIGIFLVFYTFWHKYDKGEIYLFFIGIFIGLILELIGNVALGQQWAEASFFRVPIWLPLFWGYGFVVIRRVGNILLAKNARKVD